MLFYNTQRYCYVVVEIKTGKFDSSYNVEVVYKPVDLIGSKAALDGSLKVEVLNSNGEVIGEGYYSAPGFNVTNLNEVGFKMESQIKVLCQVEKYMLINENDEFSCKVSPVNMWIIEC